MAKLMEMMETTKDWLAKKQESVDSLSLNCGLPKGAQYYDSGTSILWQSDADYIQTGETAVVSYDKFNIQNPLNTLRYFKEDRSKHCYLIPDLTQGNYYLVRTIFLYMNYDGLNTNTMSFSFIIDTQEWNITLINAITTGLWEEYMVPAKSSSMSICLAKGRAGNFTPFISSLELRSLPNTLPSLQLLNSQYALRTLMRHYYGDRLGQLIRYPIDLLDRYWDPINYTSPPLETSSNVYSGDSWVPQEVLKIASHITSVSIDLRFINHLANYTIAFYFAEIDSTVLEAGYRVFDIYLGTNTLPLFPNIDIFKEVGSYNEYTVASTIMTSGITNFYFKKKKNSLEGAILSGLELMQITENPLHPGTLDVWAIEDVKKELNLLSWMGDPCLPYRFNWLNCTSGSQIQVNALFLSNKNLQGILPSSLNILTALEIIELNGNMLTETIPDLSNLQALRKLDLSNNKLNGTIPDWLATLPNLKILSLKSNNFEGRIPEGLLQKQAAGTLSLYYDSTTTTDVEKKSSLPIIIGVVIGVLSLVAIIVGVIIAYRTGCFQKSYDLDKEPNTSTDVISVNNNITNMETQDEMEAPMTNFSTISTSTTSSEKNGKKVKTSSTREFSYHEIESATNNFQKVLGEGGSGPVYFGTLHNGDIVAVKKLVNENDHGLHMFTTEVEILSTVHHLNLVPMLGYCHERGLMLVYRCMPNGTLSDYLYGKKRKTPLSWRTRLLIALGAAEGLDYLHTKCRPQIIHRDVKSDNILLDDNLCAKVSDFGISRSPTDNDTSYVQTKAMGTRGYADPEMIESEKLTTKSDVYSFGVVLMEILCGRPPIDTTCPEEEVQIVKAVKFHVRNGDLLALVDPSLTTDPDSKYDMTSMWTVADIALNATRKKGVDRPSMKEMVTSLNEAIKMEFGTECPLFEDPSAYN